MPRQGLFFVYAAHFLRPLCGDSACLFCSPRTEHLLIYRIQSHTHPKRRKFCLKHAGQKSVKDKLPEQRKGPKRAAECRLKVPTHVWEDTPGQSHNFISGCCAVGSAPALGARCREFESPHSDHRSILRGTPIFYFLNCAVIVVWKRAIFCLFPSVCKE